MFLIFRVKFVNGVQMKKSVSEEVGTSEQVV
jgi:hypothetical protein